MFVLGFALAICLTPLSEFFLNLIPNLFKEEPLDTNDRIRCPGFRDEATCKSHGCIHARVSYGPSCFMKKDSFGFKVEEISESRDGMEVRLSNLSENTPYGPSFTSINVSITYITTEIVRVKFLDNQNERFQVPVQNEFPLLQERQKVDRSSLAYEVLIHNKSDIFSFQIKRLKDPTVLWDTSIGGLMLSDQFLQISSYLPSKNIYGLGEHTHPTLRHPLMYNTWPMFTRDQFPEGDNMNLYGVHPFYTCLENSTNSHGVLFLNSNAMDVELLPAPGITFRTIGGIIDLFFFVGTDPESVVKLYTSLVGRTQMPPYWSLGFQLSRYGYNSLDNLKTALERTRKADIAQDVQFLDIDHMEGRRDFTFDKNNFAGLVEYINKTREEYGMKWIIILDPGIEAVEGYDVYESGLQHDVFIKRSPFWKEDMFPEELRKHNITYGKVWPESEVAFPDFFKESTRTWWKNTIIKYHKKLPFDGLWIDMNEPANFGTNENKPTYCENKTECWGLKCPESSYEDPPYNPGVNPCSHCIRQYNCPVLAALLNIEIKCRANPEDRTRDNLGKDRLSTKTLCMESVQSDGQKDYRHYDVHSLYGWSQSQPTLKAVEFATRARSLVISRSTYPSSGRFIGHWLGDNKSKWDDLHRSIIGMLEFNIFGIPYVGADVCGFMEDTTPELCMRWMQLGAFYPFFRNHNNKDQKAQDPGAFEGDEQKAMREAVKRRYTLNPYLYTLFYHAQVHGDTVVRPLFHEFPKEEETWNISEQFMWGKCLLISPILQQGKDFVLMYLPKAEWWHFRYFESRLESTQGDFINMTDTSDNIPLHVKGGCIIPTEDYRLKTSNDEPTKNISLYIFPYKDEASGEIFIDKPNSRDSIKNRMYDIYSFYYRDCIFKVHRKTTGQTFGASLVKIHVFKVKTIQYVWIGNNTTTDFSFNRTTNVLEININQELHEIGKITWKNPDKRCPMLG